MPIMRFIMRTIKLGFLTAVFTCLIFYVHFRDFPASIISAIRNVFPSFGGHIAFLYVVYLAPVFTVLIIAFAAGIVVRADPKAIRLAAITFILIYWLLETEHNITIAIVDGHPPSGIVKECIWNIIMLLTLPFLSKWLCLVGGKVHSRLRKGFTKKAWSQS